MTFIYNEEVSQAKAERKPIVALESTIIAHGFSYPANLTLARELEEQIRTKGAIPATIALLDGHVHIGLNDKQLERIATDKSVEKISARDIAYKVTNKSSGATTVASTIRLAHLAGIRVFATGGIGGVHRFAQENGDVSGDLEELAQREMLVVSAGAKSILDLGLTLEKLESLNVPVVGYNTDIFPAFYSRISPFPLYQNVHSAREAANIAFHHWQWNGKGILLANPIPAEFEIPAQEIESIIETALQEGRSIRGKALTPLLLASINRLTGGRAQEANRALALHNAKIGAEIALAMEHVQVKRMT